MTKPRILITLDHSFSPAERLFINLSYVRAIEDAGAEPILIGRPSEEEIIKTLQHADGLLLSGGDDIDPEHYGRRVKSCFGKLDPTRRDHCEMVLMEHACAKKIPILGICRGLQLINVYFGGTLHQDITQEAKNHDKHDFISDQNGTRIPRDYRAHNVSIVADSLLHEITKEVTLSVNSLHHQGIDQIGSSLRAVAYSQDGLIEGIEGLDESFLLGIQWHPEELKDEPSLEIFHAFVDAARKSMPSL